MRLDDLRPNEGSRQTRKRLGRGRASGTGKTSGRGQKGQGSRAGGNVRPGFEGGQTPLHMRTPKLRGPYSRRSRNTGLFRQEHAIVNVGDLSRFPAEAVIDHAALVAANLCRPAKDGLRVLGSGELTVKLTVVATHFSATAKEKIEATGGTAQVVGEAASE